MARTNPAKFIRQVRQEMRQVTWPTRKETGVTTIMVFIMVTLAAIFLTGVDWVWAQMIQLVLGLGSG